MILVNLIDNLRGMCAFTEPYGRCEQSRELRDFCSPCRAAVEIERLERLYHELLYAVGNHHAGESRHETALRYIRQAEQSHGPASAAHGSEQEGPT